jgi:hypothetical protein
MLFPSAPDSQAFQHSLWFAQSQGHILSCITKQSDNPKKFKLTLQKFSYENSFHSLDEYFELQKKIKFI